jgi:IS4 transposase
MKTRFLFPYYFKFIGIVLFLVHLPLVLFWKNGHSDPGEGLLSTHHLFFVLTVVLMVLGLVMIAFSKEKIEDEQISQLRLDSLQWAIYLNYFLLIVSLVLTTGGDAKDIIRMNLWGPLMFFIIRFRWVLYRLNRSLN